MPIVTFPTKDKSQMLVGVGGFLVQWEKAFGLFVSSNGLWKVAHTDCLRQNISAFKVWLEYKKIKNKK